MLATAHSASIRTQAKGRAFGRRAAVSALAAVLLAAGAGVVYADGHDAEAGTTTQTQDSTNSNTVTQTATANSSATSTAERTVNRAGSASTSNTTRVRQLTVQTGGGTQVDTSQVSVTQTAIVMSTVDGVTETITERVTRTVTGLGEVSVTVTTGVYAPAIPAPRR